MLEPVEPWISFPFANYKTFIKLKNFFFTVLSHTYGRKQYLNEVSDFAKYLSNLLLYYMCQLPV